MAQVGWRPYALSVHKKCWRELGCLRVVPTRFCRRDGISSDLGIKSDDGVHYIQESFSCPPEVPRIWSGVIESIRSRSSDIKVATGVAKLK